MQGYNHVAGGVVFTGIFSSFHDVNVFSTPSLVGATVFFALLPDVDHTRSLIGKVFYPAASFLQKRFGHRTITHSLFFYLSVIGLMWLAPKAYAVVCTYALGSHLLFDMCTKQGIPLLYPFSKRPFVLPANPGLRLSAQDHRSEAIVFVVFLVCGFFCQPLFADGFWTSYNKAFATWEHVEREALRSHDLLHVTWTDEQKRRQEGLFYKKDGSGIVVLTLDGFKLVPPAEQPLVSFEHSGYQLQQQQHTITDIRLDSLNRLTTAHCIRVQIQSTEDLSYFTGNIMQTGKLIDLEYQKNLIINQLPHDDTEIINQIELLNIDHESQRRRYEMECREYRSKWQKVRSLETLLKRFDDEYEQSSDYQKGRIIKQRQEAERALETVRASVIVPPVMPDFRRFGLERALLTRKRNHQPQINCNLITVTWNSLQPKKTKRP